MQRRSIEVVVDGEAKWCEFDVVRSFADEAEARSYALQERIEDVKI